MIVNTTFKGVDLKVYGQYEKEENTIWYDNDLTGYPGSQSSFTVDRVLIGKVDVTTLINLEELEELILTELQHDIP